MTLVRTKSSCLLVRLKSNRPTCELRVTGVGALKRNPALFRIRPLDGSLSPVVKSLAGYLAAAAARACIAAGFMPTAGKIVFSWAVVRVVIPPEGFGKRSSPRPKLGRGTVRRTVD